MERAWTHGITTPGGKDTAPPPWKVVWDGQAEPVQASPSFSSWAFPSMAQIPRLCSSLPAGPWPDSLTVQLYFTQSSQKCEAENFLRMTTVMPCSRHCPTPTMFPAERSPQSPDTSSPASSGRSLAGQGGHRALAHNRWVFTWPKAPGSQALGRRRMAARSGAALCT